MNYLLILSFSIFLAISADDPPATADDQNQTRPGATSAQEGTLIVLNKAEATASLINPKTGATIAKLEIGEGPHEVTVSPDGKTADCAIYGQRQPGRTLAVINVPDATVEKIIDLEEYHRPHGILYLSDGKHVVVTAEVERKLLIVNVEAGEVTAAIDTDQNVSHMVALSPDEKTAYVANIRSGSVSVIDLEGRSLKKIIETGAGAEGVWVEPNGKYVWVSNRSANTLSVIDAETLEVVKEIECGDFPIRVMISPDGEYALVSNARSGDVAAFSTKKRSQVARIEIDDETVDEEEQERRLFGRTFGASPVPIGIIFQPDGQRAYVANSNSDTVVVIDTQSWRIVERFRTGREPDGLGWSPSVARPAPATLADDDEEEGSAGRQ